MKKILFATFILLNTNNLLAQDNTDSLSSGLHYGIKDYWKFMSLEHGSDIGIGYDFLNFPNNSLLTNKWGLNEGLRVAFPHMFDIYFPLMFDIYFSWHELQINAPLHQSKYQNLKASALETSLSVFPVPPMPYGWKLSQLSEHVVPYGGIGFQMMRIFGTNGLFKDSESNVRIYSFLWKMGCNIYIPKLPLVINVEYKRTLSKNKLKDVERFSLGLFFESTPLTNLRSKRITPKVFFD